MLRLAALRVPVRERSRTTRPTLASGSLRPPLRGACGILLVWLAFACFGGTGQAEELALDPAASTVFFIGIKNDLVAVPGSFTGLSGAMDAEKGTGWVEVAVSTLATGDEERDGNILTTSSKPPGSRWCASSSRTSTPSCYLRRAAVAA